MRLAAARLVVCLGIFFLVMLSAAYMWEYLTLLATLYALTAALLLGRSNKVPPTSGRGEVKQPLPPVSGSVDRFWFDHGGGRGLNWPAEAVAVEITEVGDSRSGWNLLRAG